MLKTIYDFVCDKEYRTLLLTTFSILVVGTLFYHYVEGWNYLDSLYFSVICLTTVGFGDLAPSTDIGKIFTMFYILAGLGLILEFIQTVYNHYAPTSKKQ